MNSKLRKRKEQALRRVAVYQKLFSTAEGNIILDDLEKTFDSPPLVKSNEGSHYTSVRVGELNVIRYIKEVLKVDINQMESEGE